MHRLDLAILRPLLEIPMIVESLLRGMLIQTLLLLGEGQGAPLVLGVDRAVMSMIVPHQRETSPHHRQSTEEGAARLHGSRKSVHVIDVVVSRPRRRQDQMVLVILNLPWDM